jgi:hypothetical protein
MAYPEGTTHIFRNNNLGPATEFYKETGVSKGGYPEYVRWIKTRNAWAKVPQAFDHVKNYAERVPN